METKYVVQFLIMTHTLVSNFQSCFAEEAASFNMDFMAGTKSHEPFCWCMTNPQAHMPPEVMRMRMCMSKRIPVGKKLITRAGLKAALFIGIADGILWRIMRPTGAVLQELLSSGVSVDCSWVKLRFHRSAKKSNPIQENLTTNKEQ